ncbi:MAG: TIGR00282 family metallophosphoesterase [Candidatus Cloacimonetes bacterium]|jgi:metallophosphoesterase (TIGR00282 family)|nr:TIGR00282 family metallophosphoesterase [Candidatus Cloacimonadota bacterium]MDD2422596.1 TIGR00282 family metallophosphoesterase [Candidatus Cloacimonadota bacterium]MDD3563514.1 TIGR00282 family metallophosphoesterase [Candidatus Cloacimonadota bacterium]MDD4276661.1 TIGR00282 family metallophosphoesterase [Candidatus Cloacimonadota bacterium]MDY0324675.1 TIGR00282 family metallophosphoesterase [Candidatus Cloacimonadaceae bacterium]
MTILFFGDVFGKPGRTALLSRLPELIAQYNSDFVIVNGENLADGKGITERTLKPLLSRSVDVITSGNHLWDRQEGLEYIAEEPRIVRPMNYPPFAPGSMNYIIRKGDLALNVICLTGQIYMPPCDSPFLAFDSFWDAADQTLPLFVDFHAESTAEKRAFGWYVDGRASAVIGTHTHIQTADEEILSEGTAYLTDAGMTGAHDSVIGVKKEIILEKFRTSVPHRFETSDQGLMINGVALDIDPVSRQATRIERIRLAVEE